ncbi:hypothetical protein RI367_007618 [Sorochytrium milnesiophthora]
MAVSCEGDAQSAYNIQAVLNLSLADVNAYLASQGNYSFSLIHFDTADLPTQALKAAIAADAAGGVVGIVGDYLSSNTIPVSLTGDYYKLWQCSGSATSPSLSDKSTYRYFYRTVPPDNYQGVMHALIAKQMKWDTVSVLYSSDSYGFGISRSFQERARAIGITIATSQVFEPGATSSTPYGLQLNIVRRSPTRIVFFFGLDADFIMIMRVAKQMGMVGNGWTWIGGDALSTYVSDLAMPQFNDADRANANGVLYAYPLEVTSRSDAFRQQYLSAYPAQTDFEPYSLFFRDCLMSMAYSIVNLLGSRTPSQILTQSYDMSLGDFLVPFEGITGHVTFDPVTMERLGDYVVYNIYNMSQQIIYQISSSGTMQPVTTPTFADGTSQIPPVQPASATQIPTWTDPYIQLTVSLVVLTILFFVAIIAYLYAFRTLAAVKNMSLPFLAVITFGLCLVLVSSLLMVGVPTSGACNLYVLTLAIGTELVLSSVAAKTFRIWRIFGTRLSVSSRGPVQNAGLFWGCVVLIGIQLALLLGWTVVSPLQPQRLLLGGAYGFGCVSGNGLLQQTVTWILVGYDGALLAVVIYLAFVTRTAYSAFRESAYILNASLCIVLSSLAVFLFSLPSFNQTALAMFYQRTLILLACVFFTFGCLVGRIALAVFFRDGSAGPSRSRSPLSFPQRQSGARSTSSDSPASPLTTKREDSGTWKGRYHVKVVNKLFQRWRLHHVVLFAQEGMLGIFPIDTRKPRECGLLFSFRTLAFDNNAPGVSPCLEFRVLNDAYAIQFPNAAEYDLWRQAFYSYNLAFGQQAGYPATWVARSADDRE